MPSLHWIGKEKVINHHLDVPFRVLDLQYKFNEDEKNSSSGNKIIHGDNLEALKALLPEYEGKIKCIYIDPPYNTGNESWVYNDNVNDPKIKKWLGQVVGKEAEDLTRHDKWLCMMYPRLKLLHKLLADDGAIFISIDDNEQANLKLVCDEIFGSNSFIEYFSWIKTSTAPSLANKSRKTIEYILCYEKIKTKTRYKAEDADGGDAPLLNSGNPLTKIKIPKEAVFFKIDDGQYKKGIYDKTELTSDIKVKEGRATSDIEIKGEFKWTQKKVDEEINSGTSFIIKSDKFSIRYIRETETFKAPTNLLKEKYYTPLIDKKEGGVETNEGAKKEIFELFGDNVFNYPKPTKLIEFFLNLSEDKNSIILDSFSGSGTTGHAVLNLNKKDGGNRKFILVEMEEYAETITAERIKRVIKGYNDKEGTGGSFDYYELGAPLFTDDNEINELIGVEKLRQYMYYTETKSTLLYSVAKDKSKIKDNEYLLNKYNDTAYYFYYEPDNITTLNYNFLSTIKTKAEQYVIYADNCLLSKEFMMKSKIIFKKIPRDITKF